MEHVRASGSRYCGSSPRDRSPEIGTAPASCTETGRRTSTLSNVHATPTLRRPHPMRRSGHGSAERLDAAVSSEKRAPRTAIAAATERVVAELFHLGRPTEAPRRAPADCALSPGLSPAKTQMRLDSGSTPQSLSVGSTHTKRRALPTPTSRAGARSRQRQWYGCRRHRWCGMMAKRRHSATIPYSAPGAEKSALAESRQEPLTRRHVGATRMASSGVDIAPRSAACRAPAEGPEARQEAFNGIYARCEEAGLLRAPAGLQRRLQRRLSGTAGSGSRLRRRP